MLNTHLVMLSSFSFDMLVHMLCASGMEERLTGCMIETSAFFLNLLCFGVEIELIANCIMCQKWQRLNCRVAL